MTPAGSHPRTTSTSSPAPSPRPRSSTATGAASVPWARAAAEDATFKSRADLEAVVRIEFKASVAGEILRHHEGLEVDYAVDLWSKVF